MVYNSRKFFLILSAIMVFHGARPLHASVDSIIGDTGSAQTGPLMLSGGSSGIMIDSTTSTVTTEVNFVSMPATDSSHGQIIVGGDPILHYAGNANQNIFVGAFSGNFSLTGGTNTGCGDSTLNSITSGMENSAFGSGSLINLTTGNDNVAAGRSALGQLVTGGGNIAIGVGAGEFYTSNESQNIIIGSGNSGVTGENNVIRIGGGGVQSDCYIDGIYGSTIEPLSASAVFVDINGKVGTIPSSDHYKTDIHDIKDQSSALAKLRPVSFIFKSDPSKTIQFGLIAQEVEKVMPELVIYDHNKPNSVKYYELPVLILNEFQKMADRVTKLENTIEKMAHEIEKLEKCCK